MDQTAITEVVFYLRDSLIRNGTSVDGIALFGSGLSGHIQPDSDIDLIIISSDFINKDIFERSKMTMAAEMETLRKYKISMDILNMTREEYDTANVRMYYKSRIVA